MVDVDSDLAVAGCTGDLRRLYNSAGNCSLLVSSAVGFCQRHPQKGSPLSPFGWDRSTLPQSAADGVHGIARVMNHAASYTLVSIGISSICWLVDWINSPPLKWMVALWIAIWWFIRAASQLYLGRRPGDRRRSTGFAWLGVVHVGVALFI